MRVVPHRHSLSPVTQGQHQPGGVASSSTTKTTNGTTSTICRFLITDLNSSRGYAKTNYRIDFIKDKHGLYDLVSVIFDM